MVDDTKGLTSVGLAYAHPNYDIQLQAIRVCTPFLPLSSPTTYIHFKVLWAAIKIFYSLKLNLLFCLHTDIF